MKIEVLYFEGCLNHQRAVERVMDVLKREGISAEVTEVNIRDASMAQAADFLGSPTIRINGLDVEKAARSVHDYGLACRTYVVDGRRGGLPSREMIREAIRDSRSGASSPEGCCQSAAVEEPKRSRKGETLFVAGSVFAAIVASFCCVLPIVFAIVGASIAGASALFAVWRPYLLGVTFGLLGLGFYFAYRPKKKPCASGSVCAMPRSKRSGRLTLWAMSGVVALFAAFPYYSGPVADFLLSHTTVRAASQPVQPVMEHATFVIEGMNCSACATAVESKLKAVPGVRSATVSFETKRAQIEYDPRTATLSQMKQAIKDAGYRARKG